MNRLTKFIPLCFLSLLFIAPTTSNAQLGKLLNKTFKKKDKKEATTVKEEAKAPESPFAAPHAKDYTDETGTSGTYNALVGLMSADKKQQKVYKWHFIREENDDIVNKLKLYYHPTKDYAWEAKLIEKKTKLAAVDIYYSNDYREIFGKGSSSGYDGGYIMQMEAGVYAFYDLNIDQVVDVMAKDPAMLETYDKEVAQAKCEQLLKKIKKGELEKTRKKLMKYDAYKEYVGKTVFIDNYTKVDYNYADKASEDPKVFLTTHEMGKYLYHRSYYDMPIAYECGDGCQYNFVFEMNGVVVDRIKQRKESSNWSRKIPKKRADQRFVSPAYSLLDGRGQDYCFINCLYKNKDKFKVGQSYKLTVKIYANRDGENEKLLAEGSVNLKYTDNSKKLLEKPFEDLESITE